MDAYLQLEKQFKKLASYHHLAAICGWDQATMMPDGGNEARANAMSDLAVLCHETLVAPEVGEWIKTIDAQSDTLTDEQKINVREIKRQWAHATVLPSDLVEAKSQAGSKCEHQWRKQRRDNDWLGFAPNLKSVVALSREEALKRSAHTA
nr:hypothetical protein [Enterovibrio nigricans]